MNAARAIGIAAGLAVACAWSSPLVRAATGAPDANAGVVYRCGSEYTQRPCAEGRVVDAADPVTARRTADAMQTAAAERRLAERMAGDRRADEAAFRPARAASLGPPRVAEAASAPKPRHKPRKRAGTTAGDDDFVARSPKVKAAKS